MDFLISNCSITECGSAECEQVMFNGTEGAGGRRTVASIRFLQCVKAREMRVGLVWAGGIGLPVLERDKRLRLIEFGQSGLIELSFTVMKAARKWKRVGAKCLLEHSLI